ncbi:MAG: acyltransferase, partial [Desulfovibrio sp.]|nr:acyltransferase [Desulfovibrio sp.]
MRLLSFLEKAQEKGLTLANVIAYLSQVFARRFGLFWGTLLFRLKAFLLGVRLGKQCTAIGSVSLWRWPGGNISIGNGVHIISQSTQATAATLRAPTRLRVFGSGAVITIGDGSELSGASITARSQPITLGKKVLLGPNCVIVDSDFHAPSPYTERSTNPGYERDRAVMIDDYVWVGMHCLILKGVHIGKGAIIGAGSV